MQEVDFMSVFILFRNTICENLYILRLAIDHSANFLSNGVARRNSAKFVWKVIQSDSAKSWKMWTFGCDVDTYHSYYGYSKCCNKPLDTFIITKGNFRVILAYYGKVFYESYKLGSNFRRNLKILGLLNVD